MTPSLRSALLVWLAAVAACGLPAQAGELPERMAAPEQRPVDTHPPGPEAMPASPPLPSPRPGATGPQDAPDGEDTASMPADEVACRSRLEALGVAFAEHPPISEPAGCNAANPLTVSRLPGGVTLEPPAVLTCAMAEATALFVRDHASPLAQREFGSPLAAIGQASSYVCRARAGGGKLSEHAFANALDWGSLTLADGTVIAIGRYARSEPRRARLISGLRERACGPFRTVLGPGTDTDHADHFHFDLAQRRGDGLWCR